MAHSGVEGAHAGENFNRPPRRLATSDVLELLCLGRTPALLRAYVATFEEGADAAAVGAASEGR